MSIKYFLTKTNLENATNPYNARVVSTASVGFKDIAKVMVKQGTTVAESDILAVFSDALNVIEIFLEQGFRINLGELCHIYPGIEGGFDDLVDSFDASRHRIVARASAGKRLRKFVTDNLAPVKVNATKIAPVMLQIFDAATDTVDSNLSTGHMAKVVGEKLRFDKAQGDEGVYLIDAADPLEVVKVAEVLENKPSELSFLVPITPLTSGEGFIEVRTRMDNPNGNLVIDRLSNKLTMV